MLLGFVFMLVGHMLSGHGFANESRTLLPQAVARLPSAFNSIGTTILGGGIFTAVLKSFQFTGIFREELAKVMFSREYLETQSKSHIEGIWMRVSQVMFTHKFPSISQLIESSILRTYFPVDHNYSYEGIVHRYSNFEVEEVEGKIYVVYDHEMTGRIVPLEKNGEFLWTVYYAAQEDEHSYRKVTALTICRGNILIKDLQREMQQSIHANKFMTRLACKYGEKYEFRKVEKRRFRLDLPTNEQLMVQTSKVTDRMKVIVNFDPKLLDVYFVHKTIDAFEDLETSPGRIYRDYPGVLLPSHGFCLVLNKRN